MTDYEIDEIRQVRHQVSEENNHDLRRVADYYRHVEQELRSGGRFKFADEFNPAPVSEPFVASNKSA